MNERTRLRVMGDGGLLGEIEDATLLQQGADVPVTLQDGRRIVVRSSDLLRGEDGVYHLRSAAAPDDSVTIPIVQEELQAGTRKVETGRVRISKRIHEHQEVLDQPLLEEHVDVKRVIVNQPVAEAPAVRYSGDTMIVPVIKEILKVEKQLIVAEELHITRRRTMERYSQNVTLRDEEPIVERLDASGNFVQEPPLPQEAPLPVRETVVEDPVRQTALKEDPRADQVMPVSGEPGLFSHTPGRQIRQNKIIK